MNEIKILLMLLYYVKILMLINIQITIQIICDSKKVPIVQ